MLIDKRRFLKWANAAAIVALASVLASDVVAEICCPKDCVPNNTGGCVTTGTNKMVCGAFSCTPVPRSGNNGGTNTNTGGTNTGSVYTDPGAAIVTSTEPSACVGLQPRELNAQINSCVQALRSNAELLGCLVEDAAGKAEDQRTGMSCPRREAALAALCRNRCVNFANSLIGTTCDESAQDAVNRRWQAAFGDIGGNAFGSADVQGCGKLASKEQRRHNSDNPATRAGSVRETSLR